MRIIPQAALLNRGFIPVLGNTSGKHDPSVESSPVFANHWGMNHKYLMVHDCTGKPWLKFGEPTMDECEALGLTFENRLTPVTS
jgi:hypothetical protein